MNGEKTDMGLDTDVSSDSQRRSQLSDWMEIAVLIAVVASAHILGHLLEANSVAEQSVAVVGILLSLALVLLFHRRRGDDWNALGLARPKSWWKTILLALPAFLVIMTTVGLFQTLVVAPLSQGGAVDISRFDALRGNLPRLLITLVSVWLTAAFAEEVIYRGFLMGRLARILGSGRGAWLGSLVLSSVTFGLLHIYQGPVGVALTGFTGFLLGALYLLARRNLWIGILVHGLIDTVSLIAVFMGATP